MAGTYIDLGGATAATTTVIQTELRGADSGVATAAALRAYDGSTLQDHTRFIVDTFLDVWELGKTLTGLSDDGVEVIAATGGGFWRRLGLPSSNHLFQAAWFIDSSAGNDEYNGTSATFTSGMTGPIKTWRELYRRWGIGRILRQTTTITIATAGLPQSDPIIIDIGTNPQCDILINGTMTQVRTGTVTGGITARSQSTNVQQSFQDTGMSGTWTADLKRLIEFTGSFGTGAGGSFAWVEKDLGSQTVELPNAQRTVLGSLNSYTTTDLTASVATNDPYTVWDLCPVTIGYVKVNAVTVNTTRLTIVQFANFELKQPSGGVDNDRFGLIDPQVTLYFLRTKLSSPTNVIIGNYAFINCLFGAIVQFNEGSLPSIIGGVAMGSTVTWLAQSASSGNSPASANIRNNFMATNGIEMSIGTSLSLGDVNIANVTGDGLLVRAGATVVVSGKLWGANNTGVGVRLQSRASFIVNEAFSNVTVTGTGGDLANGTTNNTGPTVVDPITGVTLLNGTTAPTTQSWAAMAADYNDVGGGGYQVPAGSSVSGAALGSFLNPQVQSFVGRRN